MLTELHIHNFALIDEVKLSFDKGFNVLTGETGAGKTIILEAMNLLIGKRAETHLIGTDGDEALVEAIIIDNDKERVLSRTVTREGKNKCYIDGRLNTVSMIAEIMSDLVDYHGQHEHQALLKASNHLSYLDKFGGEKTQKILSSYRAQFEALRKGRKDLGDLSLNEEERRQRLELLNYQVDEIGNAQLQKDEDLDLEKERMRLKNAEKLRKAASAAYELLSGTDTGNRAALDQIRVAQNEISSVSEIEDSLSKLADQMNNILFESEEVAHELSKYLKELEADATELEQVDDRIHEINSLKRKYGKTITEIIKYKAKAEEETNTLRNADSRIGELKKEIAKDKEEVKEIAVRLSKNRKQLAKELEKSVQKELKNINLGDCRFTIEFSEEQKLAPHGMDSVEFLIAPNIGEDLKRLVKIASGGEASRIMLALKIALTKVDPVPILIFDEIDQGIGGNTASKVGQKLSRLSEDHQTVCITHLPQIAAFADNHFLVSKEKVELKMKTAVSRLTEDQRRDEIARMLSGMGDGDISKEHASQLLSSASKSKIGS